MAGRTREAGPAAAPPGPGAEPVSPADRVADVLARDEGLVAVFESVSPAFSRLRRPGLRKVMARLVTVEQAARVAGVETSELLARLNLALGADRPDQGGPGDESDRRVETMESSEGKPAALAAIPADRVVELDVRSDLREGKEPFSRIMAAKKDVPEGGALMLRAIFEPAPLYAVMAKQGFEHWTDPRGPEDWVVWFYRPGAADVAEEAEGTGEAEAASETEAAGGVAAADEADAGVVVLDVRGLEPPEPMVRTLAALEQLAEGDTLVQINVREPKFLLPQLAERGFEYEVREQAEDLVRVFIRHAGA